MMEEEIKVIAEDVIEWVQPSRQFLQKKQLVEKRAELQAQIDKIDSFLTIIQNAKQTP